MAEEQKKYADFDELVFESRNKEYGAYDLRKSYRGYLTKAFIIGSLLFLGAIILPIVYLKAIEGNREDNDTGVEINLKNVEVPEELPLEEEVDEEEIYEEPAQEEVQSLDDLAPLSNQEPVATIQDIVPEPKKDAVKETPPATKEEVKDKAIGTQNQEGAKVTHNTTPNVKGVEGGRGTQEVKENVKIVDKPVDTKTIHEKVDVDAEFPGGIDAFRRRVQENFDAEAVEGEGILSTTVTFVVELDGSMSQIKATGSNNSDFIRESERAVRAVRTKWRPGKKGTSNVRSRFRFPMKMRFEGY